MTNDPVIKERERQRGIKKLKFAHIDKEKNSRPHSKKVKVPKRYNDFSINKTDYTDLELEFMDKVI